MYDGSWIEWGYLADSAEGGALPADSPWRTDTAARSDSITYNQDAGQTVEPLPSGDIVDAYAPYANLVNVEDGNFGGGGEGGGGFEAPGY